MLLPFGVVLRVQKGTKWGLGLVSAVVAVSLLNVVTSAALNTVVATVPVGYNPNAVAIAPDGIHVYILNEDSAPGYSNGEVSVLDANSNTVSATVTVGLIPLAIALSPDGTRAYVTNYGSGNVSVINTSTNTVAATVTVGTSPGAIAISPDGTRAYVTNNGSGNVSVINTSTNTVAATITVGAQPTGIGITRDGRRTYVANYSSFDVSVIDSGVSALPDPTTLPTATLSLDFGPIPASCTRGNPSGVQGTWVTLPSADQCSQTSQDAHSDARLLGWSTSPNFPAATAQSQVDKGWGAIDDSVSGVRMIFIPAGNSTLLSGDNTLFSIWSM